MIDCCLEFVCACLLHDINLGPTLPAGGMSAFFVFAFASQLSLHRVLWHKGPHHKNMRPSCPRGLATCHRLRPLTRNETLLRNWVTRKYSEQEQKHARLKETDVSRSHNTQLAQTQCTNLADSPVCPKPMDTFLMEALGMGYFVQMSH